jgi:hypothetical protein
LNDFRTLLPHQFLEERVLACDFLLLQEMGTANLFKLMISNGPMTLAPE